MEKYELLYIVPINLIEEQSKIVAKVETLIKKEEGNIFESESLGKKRLAYPIKNIKQGIYLILDFELATAKLKSLDRQLRLTPEVLRFMIIKKEKVAEKKVRKPIVSKREIPKFKGIKDIKKEEVKEKEKVSIEELDQKIDEILKDDIVK